jgi:hypothetical protein
MKTPSLALLVAFALTAIPGPVALAESGSTSCHVRNITQGTSDGSLATVLSAASDGDQLRVSGTCVGGVAIDTDLAIVGVGSAPTLSGGHRGRVLKVGPTATVTLQHLTIRDGAASSGGGILNAGHLTLTNVRILDNRAGHANRCGLWPDPTCDYRRNTSNVGGGILNDGTLTMVATRVRHNRAGVGGGIVNRGRMTISRSTIARNVAAVWGEGWGGGIVNSGSLTIRRSTIARNTAISGESSVEGGGILNSGHLIVSESTISQNRARGGNNGVGGGIANGSDYGGGDPGDILLEATTVTGNQASGDFDEPGGISVCIDCEVAGTVTVRASIITGNGHDCAGDFTSAGHNLIGVADRSCRGFAHGVAHDQVGTPGHPIDPMLGPLTDNGGLTTTHALRTGSPAIGRAGLAPCVTGRDQRGVRRPQGRRCDIGAFERR